MKIQIKRHGEGLRAAAAAGGIEEVQVPTGLLALLSALTGLLPALATVATLFFVTKPNAEQTRGIELGNYQLKLVERALQVENADGRRNSLRLLRGVGMLHSGNDADLEALLKRDSTGSDTLPLWKAASPSSDATQRSPAPRQPARDSTATTGKGT